MHIEDMNDPEENARDRAYRAMSQMTLGELISELERLPADAMVGGIMHPHSYRGYYEDLAFEPGRGFRAAQHLLADCRGCVGRTFYGYKGGEYVMDLDTAVWIAERGRTGARIMGITTQGVFATAHDQY